MDFGLLVVHKSGDRDDSSNPLIGTTLLWLTVSVEGKIDGVTVSTLCGKRILLVGEEGILEIGITLLGVFRVTNIKLWY